MTPQHARIVQAEADARAARSRLSGSVAAVQDRLSPATLMRGARREVDDVRSSARRVAADIAPRPLVLGGGMAALLILGGPLIRWRRRRKVAKRAARIRGD